MSEERVSRHVTTRSWPVPRWRFPVVLIAVGVICVFFDVIGGIVWLILNILAIAIVVLDWSMAPSPKTLRMARNVPASVPLDSTEEIEWIFENPTGRLLTLEFADSLPWSLRAESRRGLIQLAPNGESSISRRIQPARRGSIELDEVTVRIHGPLGLIARQADITVMDTIRVYPAFPSRDRAELALKQARRQVEGMRTVRQRGQGTEFDQLREYTPDDETRRIDWAATARALKPIVKTFRAERNQQVLILLDHGRTMAGRTGRDAVLDSAQGKARAKVSPRLEHTMDTALSLTTVATGMGDRVGLVAFADTVTVDLPPKTGQQQTVRMIETLADIEPELVESDFDRAFGGALRSHRRRALVVVLTDLASAPVCESLVPAVKLLTRRHIVVIGAVADPTVQRWATMPPKTPEGGYRMAAAIREEMERRRAATALEHAGAKVLDYAPRKLPMALVDFYLDTKSMGQL